MLGMIISLASGALGGNVAGALMKKFSLGTLWNSVVGILGGGIGGSILSMIGMGGAAAAGADTSLDVGSVVGSVATGGVGGGALMAIIGMVRGAMGR